MNKIALREIEAIPYTQFLVNSLTFEDECTSGPGPFLGASEHVTTQ